MTPDIELNGVPIELSMRNLSELSADGTGTGWKTLNSLVLGYEKWIEELEKESTTLPSHFATISVSHILKCKSCLIRMRQGIELLKNNSDARDAFRLTNISMLLQQITTKQLIRRQLHWSAAKDQVVPNGEHRSPWQIFNSNTEETSRLGNWRAFQIAFLLMSLQGITNPKHADREIVDLIWFPTGGGKTEAYLAVIAYCMFFQRFSANEDDLLQRDGTNVLMRYTLRMLTTQQFQRAASLICCMEYIRRNASSHGLRGISGQRFSLGLWVGGDGSPNKIKDARSALAAFKRGDEKGNPLILTECPWCRAEIGRCEDSAPIKMDAKIWSKLRVKGITESGTEGPLLHCPDTACEFGKANYQSWLPVEVIDERIYESPPSLVIATADKFAMATYRPKAGALFGRRELRGTGTVEQVSYPPSLIVQDELHLISGPLGTMYALYEGIFERLCSVPSDGGTLIVPKIISSTATIRGAADQINSLYARSQLQLFPSPGLTMGDSFFGKYAKDQNGHLKSGRLYLGIHAPDYGSILTTQVRTFSSCLFRPWEFQPNDRDPWWTLLAFYNSIRELGGARTLFDSDIRSRLKFIFNREAFAHQDRRNLRIVEELTSRLSQAEIVGMMDQLGLPYDAQNNKSTVDACLASNIIEVGVDIDRLSLMAVVGQPKTTATYIQVTGRVGRRWWERPGLILTLYNPSKSRDRSHYEQFQSYHLRLYERVEPTTATPFATSAILRGLAGALSCWTRQFSRAPVSNYSEFELELEFAYDLLRKRCEKVQSIADQARSLDALERVFKDLKKKWSSFNPQEWEHFPQQISGEYLMLWPGQFATGIQKKRGCVIPSSMRQVDRSAELEITQGYASEESA
ncbi:helicase-related protein [Methylocapsa palsarum]|uniref:Helicase conserved C-terminal domain-containing protein n=1 Tax=Methylocapsa palsarum TaxID=1612308 RepID=A0A1I4DBV7_9HYPH|nr:helicase-related protein [Methylocapsa palsarum]SFK90585.1 Helicase conserved C-terminal domain-containing protein [Methylocapsa palsarum]